MIYEYVCKCGNPFEVYKSVAHIDDIEKCPVCESDCDRTCRIISKHKQFIGASDWNKTEYNVGLGQYTSGSKDRARKAKAMGLIELGDEPVEKLHKKFENDRKEQSEKRWNDVADKVRFE